MQGCRTSAPLRGLGRRRHRAESRDATSEPSASGYAATRPEPARRPRARARSPHRRPRRGRRPTPPRSARRRGSPHRWDELLVDRDLDRGRRRADRLEQRVARAEQARRLRAVAGASRTAPRPCRHSAATRLSPRSFASLRPSAKSFAASARRRRSSATRPRFVSASDMLQVSLSSRASAKPSWSSGVARS